MPLWTPARTDAVLWLDSADNGTITKTGNELTGIQDKSGGGNDGAPPSTGARPTHGVQTLNGLPVLRFDGSDDEVRGACVASLDSTLFLVARVHTYSAFGRVFAHRGGDAASVALAAGSASGDMLMARSTDPDGRAKYRIFPVGAWGVFTAYNTNGGAGTELLRANGTIPPLGSSSDSQLAAAALPTHSYSIGSRWGAPHLGVDVAEAVYMPGFSSDPEYLRMEGYLAHKWGLAESLPAGHPYKGAAPVYGVYYGVITDVDGNLAPRSVSVLDSAGQCVATTTSNAITGAYQIELSNDTPHTLVFYGEPDRNAIVYANVIPGESPA